MDKYFFATLIALLFLTACSKDKISGSGPVATETRHAVNFTKITANGSAPVYITQGANFGVQVKGYSNLLPYMETIVNGNTLNVGYRHDVNVKNDNVEVYVTLPTLESVVTNGSGNIETKGAFNGASLQVGISGSANVNIESGNVALFKVNSSGSGNVKAFGLTARKAEVSISGSGTAEVWAVDNLKATIAGSGVVYYKGQPVIETSISGSGKVQPK
jgi:hypothetical protein